MEITEIDGTYLKFDRKKLGTRDMGEWCSKKNTTQQFKQVQLFVFLHPHFYSRHLKIIEFSNFTFFRQSLTSQPSIFNVASQIGCISTNDTTLFQAGKSKWIFCAENWQPVVVLKNLLYSVQFTVHSRSHLRIVADVILTWWLN